MKLLLLHGVGIISSRKKLTDLKSKFDPNNVFVFDDGSDIQTMLGSIVTPSLLGEEKLIVLENPPDDLNDNLPSKKGRVVTIPLTLIFWFDHEINGKKSVLSFVRENRGEILFFPESKEISVFPFLDSLAAGDRKAFLELDKLKERGFDTFYLITMVFYFLRNLISTPKNAPLFVKSKLQKQREKFDKEYIVNIYKHILDIEFKTKLGLLDVNHAEFLLVGTFVK